MDPRDRPRAASRLAVMTVFVLPALVIWLPGSAEAATTRAFVITGASAKPLVGFGAFDGNPIKLYDIDGDGVDEIIAQNDNQWAYVFDSKTGALRFEVKTKFPAGWGARSFNGPEVVILRNDGKVNLVLANSAATITSYVFDPAGSTGGKFKFVKQWERRLTDCHPNPGMDAKPVLADLDLDGTFEILAATEELGVYALRADGRIFWKKCIGGGNGEPGVGDLDGNGWPDVVFGSDGGVVTAMDGRTGATRWTYNVAANFPVGTGSMPVGPAIAQLDGKDGPDIVVGVRDSHDANDWSKDHALLLALDSNGRLLWGKRDANANPLTYTRPIVVDADKNGAREVYWGDWNTNGHKPPFNEADAWKVTGPANFYRYDAAGNLVWRQTLGTFWSNKDLALADVDGDGVQEVLANGPNGGRDGIWYLDSRTGAKEAFVDMYPWKAQRGPVVADLWGTGTMQWVIAAEPMATNQGPAIMVFDTGRPYDAAWPHVPDPVRGGAPPPPPGEFGATFRVTYPAPDNPWWQQVKVVPDSPQTLSKVEIRIGGDPAWRGMSRSSWGDAMTWTSSYKTSPGTKVEFLATASNGLVSQSAPFIWRESTSQRSVPFDEPAPSPPEPFSATFALHPHVNEWWVAVQVKASDPLATVDAQVDGGAWFALDEQDWGEPPYWAKGMNAPIEPGTPVRFRATSSGGDQALSETYSWLDDGGAFSVAWTLEPNSNRWWFAVQPKANHPVTRVEASVNGGSWFGLEKQTWGTPPYWAKTMSSQLPTGAEVRFRATDDKGATVTSAAFRWT